MMKCETCRELMMEYVQGELAEARAAEVEAHLYLDRAIIPGNLTHCDLVGFVVPACQDSSQIMRGHVGSPFDGGPGSHWLTASRGPTTGIAAKQVARPYQLYDSKSNQTCLIFVMLSA